MTTTIPARTKESYLKQFRQASSIIGEGILVEGESTGRPNYFRQLIIEIEGTKETPGFVFYKSEKNFQRSLIGRQKDKLSDLQGRFTEWQNKIRNQGDLPPKEWPEFLANERNRIEAKIQVYNEEVVELKRRLKEAEDIEASVKPEESECLPTDKGLWGNGRLRNGMLVSIGGQKTAMKNMNADEENEDGKDPEYIMCIADDRSPYNNMEVWRFKSEVMKALSIEMGYRQRLENKRAKAEDRAAKILRSWPEAPSWDAKTKTVTLPDSYSDFTKNKLKQE